MIRQKPRLIIAFPSTTQAIDMERKCRAAGLPGRLIPLPREISAGCGMAWMAEPDQEDALRALISREAIKTEGIYIL